MLRNKHKLKVHMLIHTGQKDFGCPYCTYVTYVKHNLKKHCLARHKVDYPPAEHPRMKKYALDEETMTTLKDPVALSCAMRISSLVGATPSTMVIVKPKNDAPADVTPADVASTTTAPMSVAMPSLCPLSLPTSNIGAETVIYANGSSGEMVDSGMVASIELTGGMCLGGTGSGDPSTVINIMQATNGYVPTTMMNMPAGMMMAGQPTFLLPLMVSSDQSTAYMTTGGVMDEKTFLTLSTVGPHGTIVDFGGLQQQQAQQQQGLQQYSCQ